MNFPLPRLTPAGTFWGFWQDWQMIVNVSSSVSSIFLWAYQYIYIYQWCEWCAIDPLSELLSITFRFGRRALAATWRSRMLPGNLISLMTSWAPRGSIGSISNFPGMCGTWDNTRRVIPLRKWKVTTMEESLPEILGSTPSCYPLLPEAKGLG